MRLQPGLERRQHQPCLTYSCAGQEHRSRQIGSRESNATPKGRRNVEQSCCRVCETKSCDVARRRSLLPSPSSPSRRRTLSGCGHRGTVMPEGGAMAAICRSAGAQGQLGAALGHGPLLGASGFLGPEGWLDGLPAAWRLLVGPAGAASSSPPAMAVTSKITTRRTTLPRSGRKVF